MAPWKEQKPSQNVSRSRRFQRLRRRHEQPHIAVLQTGGPHNLLDNSPRTV